MGWIVLLGISISRLSAFGTLTPSPFAFFFHESWKRTNKELVLETGEWNNLLCGQRQSNHSSHKRWSLTQLIGQPSFPSKIRTHCQWECRFYNKGQETQPYSPWRPWYKYSTTPLSFVEKEEPIVNKMWMAFCWFFMSGDRKNYANLPMLTCGVSLVTTYKITGSVDYVMCTT